MGICGSRKSGTFRPTGFKDGDGKNEDDNNSLIGSVVLNKKGELIRRSEMEIKIKKKDEKEKSKKEKKEEADQEKEDKAKTKDKENLIFEQNDIKVMKFEIESKEVEKKINQEEIELKEAFKKIDHDEEKKPEKIILEEDIDIAFSNSQNSEIQENKLFLEELMNTKRSHYSKPNFSNVLMAKELASEIAAARSEKINQKKKDQRKKSYVEEFKIDPLGDVNNQYLNLYMMMKPEEFDHREGHPQFDGEYCVYDAEGFARKEIKVDEDSEDN